MQEHTEQHLDKLTKKLIQSSSLESPSQGFTANVMYQIESLNISRTTTYKPLISKVGWAAIITILVGISAYVMLTNVESISWFDKVDLSILSNNKLTNTISGITFSRVMIYSIVMFGLLWFVQIQLVKKQLERQLKF